VLVQLSNPWNLDLWLLKSDIREPHLGGNKYHKLRGYLGLAVKRGVSRLVTMAGAHSNHLRAFAAACSLHNYRGHAIIRGDELKDKNRQSPELKFAASHKLDISFVSRAVYRQLREAASDSERAALVPDVPFAEAVFIPEGGLGADGVTGVMDWARAASEFENIFIACATGTTCAGFLHGTDATQKICGVAVVRNAAAVRESIRLLAPGHEQRFELITDYTLGGFAKTTAELLELCTEFSKAWQLTIDPAYVGRVVMALRDRARAGGLSGRVLIVYTYNE
jgi:1-aminocyclopropane-1-carboxylate deaminase